MKKTFGLLLTIIIAFSLSFITPAYADNGVIIVSQKNIKIGDNVSVMLTYNSTEPLSSVSGTLTFDPNILKYTAGGNACLNNTVTIKESVKGGATNLAYSITFTAIANGKNSFSFNMKGNKLNGASSEVTQGAVVSVEGDTVPPTNALPNGNPSIDPLAVTVDSKSHKIVNNVASIPEIPNFTRSVTKYKDIDVNTLTDVNGKYVLYYLSSDETNQADWFVKDDSDEFFKLKYITFQDKMYIIEEETDSLLAPPENWILSDYEIKDGVIAKCYKSTKSNLSDFRIFHCYYDGDSSFYRYDTNSKVLQIDPEFVLTDINSDDNEQDGNKLLKHFQSLPEDGRLLVIFVTMEILAIFVLIISVIINHKKKTKNTDENEIEIENENEIKKEDKKENTKQKGKQNKKGNKKGKQKRK